MLRSFSACTLHRLLSLRARWQDEKSEPPNSRSLRSSVLATGVVIAVGVVAAARTVVDLVDRLLSLSVVAVLVCLPLLFLPYLIFVVDPFSEPGIVALIGLSAVVPSNVALLAGVLVRDRRLREASTEMVVVTVGDSEDNNQRELRIAAVVIIAITLITTGAVTILTGGISTTMLTTLIGGLSPVFLLFADTSRELAVTDVGFRVNQSITDWDDLAGYRLTDDKVVLVREQWYTPARRVDREEINDEETLVDGLAMYLPRVDAEGEIVDREGGSTSEREYG